MSPGNGAVGLSSITDAIRDTKEQLSGYQAHIILPSYLKKHRLNHFPEKPRVLDATGTFHYSNRGYDIVVCPFFADSEVRTKFLDPVFERVRMDLGLERNNELLEKIDDMAGKDLIYDGRIKIHMCRNLARYLGKDNRFELYDAHIGELFRRAMKFTEIPVDALRESCSHLPEVVKYITIMEPPGYSACVEGDTFDQALERAVSIWRLHEILVQR